MSSKLHPPVDEENHYTLITPEEIDQMNEEDLAMFISVTRSVILPPFATRAMAFGYFELIGQQMASVEHISHARHQRRCDRTEATHYVSAEKNKGMSLDEIILKYFAACGTAESRA